MARVDGSRGGCARARAVGVGVVSSTRAAERVRLGPEGGEGLEVSRCCLGTMTFGQQNTSAEAAEQLGFALDAGVNFLDTAEMYPVPAKVRPAPRGAPHRPDAPP